MSNYVPYADDRFPWLSRHFSLFCGIVTGTEGSSCAQCKQGYRPSGVCHENGWCGGTGQAHDKRRKLSRCLINLHGSNSLNDVLPGPGTPLRMQPVRPRIDSRFAPCWQVFVFTRRLYCSSVICLWSWTGVAGFLMRILSGSTKHENAMAKYM